MNKTLKIVLITLGAVAIVLLGLWLVGSQSDQFGAAIGITRYPNSGVAARAAYFGTTIPSSLTDGAFTADGAATLSGTVTLSGTNSVTGSVTSECTKFYASDATTAASSTYYITVNTSATTTGSAFVLQATTTKPTLCP